MQAKSAARALRALYPFRMRVHDDRYDAREVVGPGGDFYDILLGWRDDDGSVVFNDIGGQRERDWNPQEGHGSIWRFGRDGALTPIVPPGHAGRHAFIHIIRGNDSFVGRDDIFIVAQGGPGRAAASAAHLVLRVRPGGDTPEPFATVPHHGRIGGGAPGAMMPDFVGRAGTRYQGSLFVHSMMNCTIYRVPAQGGEAEVFAHFDEHGEPIMPVAVRQAPDSWGELAGEMVFFGARAASFETGVPSNAQRGFWHVTPDGRAHALSDAPSRLDAVVAPPEFGPYAGELFWADEGPVNLAQIAGCDMYAEGLPYTGRVMRRSADGEVHVFADDFYGSYTSLVFDGDRLVMGLCGRSYSTGEFHEPDASLYEIRVKPQRAACP